MKSIAYTQENGATAICSPVEGARLARSVTLLDGTKLEGDPRPVCFFTHGWPVAGAAAEWAESEEEFMARIQAKDVPPSATNVRIVEEAEVDAIISGSV